MDTRLLRTFREVARTGSFTAAAGALSYAQSTVTSHVQALEALARTPLVDRTPAGAALTPAGERLLRRAGELLELEEQMLDEARASDAAPAGVVRLLAPESLCAYRLPAVIARVGARLPDVRLHLAPAPTSRATDELVRGRADLAVLLEPRHESGRLLVHDLGPEPLTLVTGPQHPLRDRRRLRWPDLAATDVLLLEEGCCYSDSMVRGLAAAGAPVGALTRFGSVEAVKRCVASGLGVALLPSVSVADEVAAGSLVPLPFGAVEVPHLLVAERPGAHRPAAVRAVAAELTDCLRRPASTGRGAAARA